MVISKKPPENLAAKKPLPAKKIGDVLSPEEIQKDMLRHARANPYSGGLHMIDPKAALEAHRTERKRQLEGAQIRDPQEIERETQKYAQEHPHSAAHSAAMSFVNTTRIAGQNAQEDFAAKAKSAGRIRVAKWVAGIVLTGWLAIHFLTSSIGIGLFPGTFVAYQETRSKIYSKINHMKGDKMQDVWDLDVKRAKVVHDGELGIGNNPNWKEEVADLERQLKAKTETVMELEISKYEDLTLGEVLRRRQELAKKHAPYGADPGLDYIRLMFFKKLEISESDLSKSVREFWQTAGYEQKRTLFVSHLIGYNGEMLTAF